MKDATRKLVTMMIRSKACADYIEDGWNCLYNDIMADYRNWSKLDGISALAIESWMKYIGLA